MHTSVFQMLQKISKSTKQRYFNLVHYYYCYCFFNFQGNHWPATFHIHSNYLISFLTLCSLYTCRHTWLYFSLIFFFCPLEKYVVFFIMSRKKKTRCCYYQHLKSSVRNMRYVNKNLRNPCGFCIKHLNTRQKVSEKQNKNKKLFLILVSDDNHFGKPGRIRFFAAK